MVNSDASDRYARLNFAANRRHSILRRETHEYCRKNSLHLVPDLMPETPRAIAEEVDGTDIDRTPLSIRTPVTEENTVPI